MRYIVTGAAGFIGSHLAEALAAAGHDVVGWDCFTDYYDLALKQENASEIRVDQLDLSVDLLDLSSVDTVFHLAGQPGVRSFGDVFPLYVRRNVLASQRLFEAAAAAGVRVVFTSSSSVYGDAAAYPTPEDTLPHPRSPYGITKLACEHLAYAYAKSFALDVVTLRYFTVYGPRQRPDMALARVIAALRDGETFELYGDGTQSRGFTYVGDAIEATIAAAERAPRGSTINVGGGEEATMREAIALLEEVSGRRLDVRHVPPAAGDVKRTAPDVTRAREQLGWKPRTRLRQGLEAQWNWASARVAAR
jgi:UDP-glucuronate 4-epimerase